MYSTIALLMRVYTATVLVLMETVFVNRNSPNGVYILGTPVRRVNVIKKLARYGILFAMLLTLSGCDVTSNRSDKPSPDWSRGLKLGVSRLNQPVALQIDGEGHAHLVWYTKVEEVSKLHYAQLDDQGKVVVQKDLAIPLFDPHQPQLLLDKGGNMHLALLAREDGIKSLFHLLLGEDGEALSEPTRLSSPSIPSPSGGDKGGEVESYQTCLGQEGRIEVFWSDKEGIAHISLDEGGDAISPPTLIVPQGINPSAQVDRSGTIHLAWAQETPSQGPMLHYAAFQIPEPVNGTRLARLGMVPEAALYGPVLGLDMDSVYIFWSLEQRAGLEVGTAQSYYVSFPSGQPSRLTPIRINIASSDFVTMPSVAGEQRSEVAATFNVYVSSGFKSYFEQSKMVEMGPVSIGFRPEMQLAQAVFAEGQMMGYQLAANTDSASLRPNLVADPASNLHLTWLDTAGFGRYDVYYASTSPPARAWLDRTRPKDVLLEAADLAVGMLSGVALLPFLILWIFLPLLLLVLFYVFVGEEELELKRVKVVLGIAIALYTGTKLVSLPISLLYLPFLDQVPPLLYSALVSGVPLIILALALAAIYAYARRADRATLFPAFLIFAVTDALLSMAIYAPGIFGIGS
jgi:hypothetical protein